MVMVILRARFQPAFEREIEAMVKSAHELAHTLPGFVALQRYAAADGEQMLLLEFETHEALAAWRDHPGNPATQGDGRDRLFRDYRIQVCDVVREYELVV